MEIELFIREIKNGYTLWNNSTYETIYCRNYDEIVEEINKILKKFVR